MVRLSLSFPREVLYSMKCLGALNKIKIILCRPSHPGNIGSVARAMKNMGLNNLVLVQPKTFPSDQAEALAAGANDVLKKAKVFDSLDAALSGVIYVTGASCRKRDLSPKTLICKDAVAEIIGEIHKNGEVALVFGNERNGLTAEEALKCNVLSDIPSSKDYPSLNISHAVQIFCYELFCQASRIESIGGSPNAEYSRYEELGFFLETFRQCMENTGFLKPKHKGKVVERLERLFRRARLEKEEMDILLGFFKTLQ